jgi:hypothetical protein
MALTLFQQLIGRFHNRDLRTLVGRSAQRNRRAIHGQPDELRSAGCCA